MRLEKIQNLKGKREVQSTTNDQSSPINLGLQDQKDTIWFCINNSLLPFFPPSSFFLIFLTFPPAHVSKIKFECFPNKLLSSFVVSFEGSIKEPSLPKKSSG